MLLSIDIIRMDGGTQPRGAVDPDVIDTYQDAMEEGAVFPPVDVFYDGSEYWLADGFHRLRAKMQTGAEEIFCAVHQGTVEDAQWFSYGANKTNGLYRSNADKQRVIESALKHPKSGSLSDAAIGKHCGVSQRTVSTWRTKLEASQKVSKIESREVTRGGTTYKQDTTNIGRKPADKPVAQPEVVVTPPIEQVIVAAQTMPVIKPEVAEEPAIVTVSEPEEDEPAGEAFAPVATVVNDRADETERENKECDKLLIALSDLAVPSVNAARMSARVKLSDWVEAIEAAQKFLESLLDQVFESEGRKA